MIVSARVFCDALLASTLGSAPAAPAGFESPFVRVKGDEFTHSGGRFNVAGINNHYLSYASRDEVDRVLDDAASMGANVVRTFIQPVVGSLNDGHVPTLWNWSSDASSNDLGVRGGYVLYWDDRLQRMAINDGPDGLERLDYLVEAARKRKLRLILAFVDFWEYTGGIQQMRAWYGSADKYTFFFADPRPRDDYRRFVAHVVERRNTISGRVYRDDPTIFAWDLANEPDIQPTSLMRSWTGEMAAFVKSLDANHLVTSGRANGDPAATDFDVPALDFLTWHGYPADAGIPADQYERVISGYCASARAHDKPIVLEEFGSARNDGDQAALYARWLRVIETTDGCAGWLVWRLVSRQDNGRYPVDDVDRFDIHNDGGSTWRTLRDAARRYTKDNR